MAKEQLPPNLSSFCSCPQLRPLLTVKKQAETPTPNKMPTTEHNSQSSLQLCCFCLLPFLPESLANPGARRLPDTLTRPGFVLGHGDGRGSPPGATFQGGGAPPAPRHLPNPPACPRAPSTKLAI